ncbi:glycoside hydrolase family 2 protein, partial [Yeosuana marina]|uniref:glycoside hydrolase family 2 protein n=1 Tax=Yeosuana marina TaxID=1565536 RepID=UPI0030C7ABF3
MILKRLFYGIFGFVFSCQLFSQQTQVIFLSGTDAANTVQWDFYCTEGQNSKKWTKIDVPSNWELQGFGTYNYGHDWKNKDIVLGKEVGWYKHSFEVPVSWKEKEITIVFDGAMTDTEVKVNGILAGSIHQGGFTRFTYNITELVKFGKKNVLEVKVLKHSKNESVNKAERQADFWIFGGIYRPVFLEVSPKQHINNLAIAAKADGQFSAVVLLNSSKEDYVLSIDLFDVEGEKVGETIQTSLKKGVLEKNISGQFEPVKAWNPEWPHLYDMKFTLSAGKKVIHEVTKRIGFRTVELRKHDGFYINGERIIFKGVNRHSFWPETGRSLSEKNHLTDIKLMKEMNMNAVRSSHYEPDERFLALCDSLGLFVLDEVAGWQDGYDTIVGPKVIKEMVLKDQNHPSVVIWDHGNEGGWNFENEKWLSYWDLQKRPIIYPWLLRNGVDTYHYPEYNYATTRFVSGNDPFMATELLHGLYDGGAGAGLDAYWRNYETSPLFAGGFLWVFSDEVVLRKDKVGVFFDSDKDHAPDGILGPHREKEASFYTIKEVWSPVQISPVTINKDWNAKLIVNNKFKFTNLNQCTFRWSALKFTIGSTEDEIVGSGSIPSPNAAPGEASSIFVNCKEALNNADVLTLTAIDPHGEELYTWRWPVVQPKEKALELFKN